MLESEKIGKIIREARKKKSLTQEQLAEAVYVKKQAVSQWEIGKTCPSLDSIEALNGILDININDMIGNGEKKEMKMKPLDTFDDFDDLIASSQEIVKSVDIDSMFEKTISTLLEYTLITVLGYECYYKSFSRIEDPEDVLDWSCVAWDISNLLDSNDNGPILDGYKYPFPLDMPLIERKIQFMSFLIGSELFEDFDEDGYRNGFIQQIGRYAESCGYDLIKIFPHINSDIFTVYKIALLKLSESLDHI